MKKELPFVIPIISCYPATSQAAGILFTDKFISEWMYNNFIQLFQVESNGAIDYYDFAIDNNPFLSYNELNYEFIYNNWNAISDFIIGCINDDYYVRLFNNVSKNSLYNNNDEMQHDILIFGYNKKNKLYKVADHFNNGRFEIASCSFDELEKAVDTYDPDLFDKNPAFLNSIQMIHKEENLMRLRFSMYNSQQMGYLLSFNLRRIIYSLQDYVNCNPTTNWYTRGRVMDTELAGTHKWGIDCYDVIKYQVINHETANLSFVLQSCFVLKNHKMVMIERIKLIDNKIGLTRKNIHIKNFIYLQELTSKLMMMVMKFFYKYKLNNMANRISLLIDEIKKTDYEYSNMLINDLKMHL